jgi:hypothetical protein
LHTFGTIFHHPQFEYSDRSIGNKLIILLNTPTKDEPYILLKTTSKQKNKPSIPGCIKSHSLFFIKAGKSFPLDTWVQLEEIYPIRSVDFDRDKNIQFKGSLDAKTINAIIDCLFEAERENIPPIIKNLLRPPFNECLLKLKEKFNCR